MRLTNLLLTQEQTSDGICKLVLILFSRFVYYLVGERSKFVHDFISAEFGHVGVLFPQQLFYCSKNGKKKKKCPSHDVQLT